MNFRTTGFLVLILAVFLAAGDSSAAEPTAGKDLAIEIFEDDPDEFKKGMPILDKKIIIDVREDGSYTESVHVRFHCFGWTVSGWTYLLGIKDRDDPLPEIETAKIHRKKGSDEDLSDFELVESSIRAYGDFYTSDVKVSIKILGLEEDDELELEYRFDHSPQTDFPDSFSSWFSLLDNTPTKKADWTVRYPASMPMQFKQVGFECKPTEGKDGDLHTYSITMKRLASVDWWLYDSPDFRSIYPYVMMTSESDWKRFGRWQAEQFQTHMTATPEMRSVVDDLTKGLTDVDDKAAAIYRYVTDKVQYFGIYLDKCGLVPHDAEEVFRKKFGDCKDKSMLFITMLDAAGIKGIPALLDAGFYYWSDRDFPMLYQFNHVITYIPEADHSKWYDPVWPPAAVHTLPQSDRGRPALVCFDEGPKFMETPPLDRDSYKKTSASKITISPDGAMRIEGEQTFEGTLGIRWVDFFRSNTQERIDEEIKSRIFQRALNPELVSFEILSDLDDGLPLRTHTVFTSAEHIQRTEDRMIFQIPYGTGYDLHKGLKNRELPLVLSPLHYTTSIDIEAPEGWRFKEVPETVEEEHPFGGFRFTYTGRDRGLHIDAEAWVSAVEVGRDTLDEEHIGIGELEKFRRFEQRLVREQKAYLVIEQ